MFDMVIRKLQDVGAVENEPVLWSFKRCLIGQVDGIPELLANPDNGYFVQYAL